MQHNETRITTPQQYAQRIAQMIQDAQNECRADIERVDDPKAQALFETLAEVLGGAMKALNDFSNRAERVWQGTGHASQTGTGAPTVTDMAVDVDASGPPPRLTDIMPHQRGQH